MKEWSGRDPSNWPIMDIWNDLEDNLVGRDFWGFSLIDITVLHDGPPHI